MTKRELIEALERLPVPDNAVIHGRDVTAMAWYELERVVIADEECQPEDGAVRVWLDIDWQDEDVLDGLVEAE